MIDFNGKKYIFNMIKLVEFFDISSKGETIENETTYNYELDDEGEGMELRNKVIREISSEANSNIDNIKYDLIKIFINKIIDYKVYPDSDKINDVGFEIVFNTMLNEGIIIEVK